METSAIRAEAVTTRRSRALLGRCGRRGFDGGHAAKSATEVRVVKPPADFARASSFLHPAAATLDIDRGSRHQGRGNMSVNIGWPERLLRLAAGILILGLYGALPGALALYHAGGASAYRHGSPRILPLAGRARRAGSHDEALRSSRATPVPLHPPAPRRLAVRRAGGPLGHRHRPEGTRAAPARAGAPESAVRLQLDQSNVRLYTKIELALRKSEREYLRRVAARIREAGAMQLATATPLRPAGASTGRLRARGRCGPGGDDDPRPRCGLQRAVARKRGGPAGTEP